MVKDGAWWYPKSTVTAAKALEGFKKAMTEGEKYKDYSAKEIAEMLKDIIVKHKPAVEEMVKTMV